MTRVSRFLAFMIVPALGAPLPAAAQVPVFNQAGTIARHACMELGTVVDGQDLSTSPSFSHDGESGYGWLVLWIEVADTDGSIRRLDAKCTGSYDANVTDYQLQECSGSAGVQTCVDAGRWQKTLSGSAKFAYRLDVAGVPDYECTFSVGDGSAAASDLLTVKGRTCAD